MTEKRLFDFFYFYIVGTVYTFAMSRAVLAATIVEFSSVQLFVLCAGFVLLFHGLFRSPRSSIIVAAVFFASFLLTLAYLYYKDFDTAWFVQLRELVEELGQFAQSKLPQREIYGQIIGTGLALLFAMIAVLNTQVFFNITGLLLVGTATILVPVSMNWTKSDLATILFIFCMIALVAKRMNLIAADGAVGFGRQTTAFSMAAIPVSALILLVSWVMPKPDQLMESLGTPRALREAADNLIYDMGSEQARTYTDVGQTLGGPAEIDNRAVMEVYADERILLSGSIRDTYTGSAWLIDGGERAESLEPDENEIYATSQYSQELLEAQLYYMRYYGWETKQIDVHLLEHRTKTVFTPPFRVALFLSGDQTPSRNQLGAISVNKPLERYSSYSQTYIPWNYDNPYFALHVLQSSAQLDSREQAEMQPYLQLPDELPQRVSDLARALTLEYDTAYGKLGAMEAYLKQFPYTLSPDPVPQGWDFVDYFLFEGKEGYCVYYASALTVMARSIGIPARYVEGFAMPPERNEHGAFTVTRLQAHAWVEAYFPSFGWLPIEATPPDYQALGESGSYQQIVTPEASERDSQTEPIPEPELPDSQESPRLPAKPGPGGQDKGAQSPDSLPVAAAVSMAAVVALSVLFFLAMRSVYRSRFVKLENLPHRQAVEGYFSRILQAAEACGYPLLAGETAHAYARRVGDSLTFQSDPGGLGDLAEIFSRAAYSQEPVPTGDRRTMQQCHRDLLRQLRREMRAPRYFFHRYVLMRF